MALILASAALQAYTGHAVISVAMGLAASQLLLVFAVRPFERNIVLIILSFLLVPVSIAIVSTVAGFAGALPQSLQSVPAWIVIAALLALSIELFVHWYREGRRRGLSIWRILGTFSIAASAGALALLLAISVMPETLVPGDGVAWKLVQNALRFRAGTLLVWLGFTVLLALPATFARPIEIKASPGLGVIVQSILHVTLLALGVISNLGNALREGARDIALLCRTAIAPVARRILFLVSVIVWQVAFSLLVDSYLSYLVAREAHALQIAPAAVLAVAAPIAIFWTAAAARLAEVVGVAARTVTLTGLLLVFCAAVAALLWWAYELLWGRRDDINWIGVASIGIIVLAVLIAVLRRGRSSS